MPHPRQLRLPRHVAAGTPMHRHALFSTCPIQTFAAPARPVFSQGACAGQEKKNEQGFHVFQPSLLSLRCNPKFRRNISEPSRGSKCFLREVTGFLTYKAHCVEPYNVALEILPVG